MDSFRALFEIPAISDEKARSERVMSFLAEANKSKTKLLEIVEKEIDFPSEV